MENIKLGPIMILLVGAILVMSIIPALLDATSNVAVMLGVILCVALIGGGVKYLKQILNFIGVDVNNVNDPNDV